ncbi:MAG TPA: D-alanyl-D-alanine carboxypeptidase [Candidatus Dormibacteraeota bacterium]|nr:D-alanyl-D-alanine carboxypeptidase [Candidatus Dormibacteraeota bacterium]
MGRSSLRLTVIVVVTGGLISMVGSAAPPRPPAPRETSTLLAAALPADELDRQREPTFSATPSPLSSPAPTAPPSATAPARPVATLRPIPLPAIDAQEVALVNLDTGRFLWQSNGRAAWAPASLTKIFTAMVAVDLLGMSTTVTVPASIRQYPPTPPSWD